MRPSRQLPVGFRWERRCCSEKPNDPPVKPVGFRESTGRTSGTCVKATDPTGLPGGTSGFMLRTVR